MVHANTGAICLFDACCTAFAVTASTAPLKNSMSSWPVTLDGTLSSMIVLTFSSSSENLGMLSSKDGKAIPPRPAETALKPIGTSGPHFDFRFRVPPALRDRFRLSFLSFFFRSGDLDVLSVLIFPSFCFLSFFFFFERDLSRLISSLISFFMSPSPFTRSPLSSPLSSPLVSPFTPSPLTSPFTFSPFTFSPFTSPFTPASPFTSPFTGSPLMLSLPVWTSCLMPLTSDFTPASALTPASVFTPFSFSSSLSSFFSAFTLASSFILWPVSSALIFWSPAPAF
mmetsp:Transcript_60356/g.143823  ORF Transcript_60356/g.143823 Transcript_60356/m.143823 type:complete len:283 (+) Transcript_60356:1097-1945(+)